MTEDKKYPDTAQGAIQMLSDETDGLDLSGAETKRDPSVLGVWKVSLKDGKTVIAFLAGYPDPYGKLRTMNDFSVSEPKGKVSEAEEALPPGTKWIIRIDGSASNRVNFYGPFNSHKDADAMVNKFKQFEKVGKHTPGTIHAFDLDVAGETVNVLTGHANVKRLLPPERFEKDWSWLNDEVKDSADNDEIEDSVQATKIVDRLLEDDEASSASFALQKGNCEISVGPVSVEPDNTHTLLVFNVSGRVGNVGVKGVFTYKIDDQDPHAEFELTDAGSLDDGAKDSAEETIHYMIDDSPQFQSILSEYESSTN